MLLQITLTSLLTLTVVVATPPPGYQAKDHQRTKHDQTEPKYKYAYKIIGEKGSQEKQEQREGIYALGRYYVQGVGSKQSVEYLADDWGYHPFIEYSNVSPHSKSSAQIAFGEEAVKALQNSQKNQNPTSIKTSFQQAAQIGSQQIKTTYLPSTNSYQRAPGLQQNGNKAVNSYASVQQGSKNIQNQQQNYNNVNQGQRQEVNHHQQQNFNSKSTISYYTNHPQNHGSNHNQQQVVNPIKTFSYYTRHQKPQQGQAKLNLQHQQFGNQKQQFGNQQQHLNNQKQQFGNQQQQQFGSKHQQQVKGQVVTAVPTVNYYSAHQQTQVVQNLGNGNQQGQDYYENQAKAQQLLQDEATINGDDQQQKIKEVLVNSNQQQNNQEQVSLNTHQQQQVSNQVTKNNHQQVSNQVTLNNHQQINNQVLPTVGYYVNEQNPQVTLSGHQEQVVGTVPTISYYANANKEQQLVQEVNKNQQEISFNNQQIQGNVQTISYLNNLPKAQQLIQQEGLVNTNHQQKIKDVSINDQQQKQIEEQITINNQQQQHLQEQLNQQQQISLNNLVLPTVSYYVNQQSPQVTLSSHQEQVVGTVPTIGYYANANKEQQSVQEVNKNQQQFSINNHQIEGVGPLVNYINNLPKAEQIIQEQVQQHNVKEVSVNDQQQQKQIQEQVVSNDHHQQVQTVSIAPIVNYYTNHPQLNQITVSNDQHQQISVGNQLQELGAAISFYSNQQKTQKGENQEQAANYFNNAEQVSVNNKEQQQQKIVQEVNHEHKIQEPVIPTISYYTNLIKAQQLKEEVEGTNNQQQEIHEQVISTVLPTIGFAKPHLNQNQHVSTISYTSDQPIAQQLVQEHVSLNQIQEVKQEKANAQTTQEHVTSKGGLYTNIHKESASAAATTTGLYGNQVNENKEQIKPVFNFFTNHQQTHGYVTVNKQQGQGVNGQGAVSYFSYHKKPQQLQVAVNGNQKEESQTDKPTISYYTNHQANDQFVTNQVAYFGHLQQPNVQENVIVIPTQSEIYGESPVHNVVLVNNAPSLNGPIAYYNKVTHFENLNKDAYENAYPHPGSYGTKINVKEQILSKDKDLVESTRNFVTGQDVLNINNVLSFETHQNSSELLLESTTPSSIPVTEKYVEGSLTKDPIVVADLEENNLSSEVAEGGYYSSTERSSSFQVTQPTLVITPRPVSKQFLAPINAGVQLQSAKEKATDTKLIIDIQKSVPYYLGNYQSKVMSDTKAEAQNNVDLIQYSLPTPEALVQLKTHVESNDLLQKTSGQVEGQTQFDYQKQQKLVVTDTVDHNVQTYLKNIESNQTVKEESFGETGLALKVLLPNHQLNQLPPFYQQTNFANIFALPPLPNIHHQHPIPQEHNNILLSSYAPNYPAAPCDNETPAAKPASTFYHAQKYPVQTYLPSKPIYKPAHQQKQRNARQSFKQNVRLEYGFMPPLIPSTEIDENGKPIEKSDN